MRQAWLADAARQLAAAGVPDPARDARLLLRWVLDARSEDMHDMLRAHGTADEHTAFRNAVSRRAGREPLSHITGTRLFWGRPFRVTRDVLDPRPETETLIAEALQRGPFQRVLDLGTGSGCLLVTLLAEWPGATGTGVDVSPRALAIARENARRLDVADRATFRQGDWLAGLEGRFDLIVSNPPYLAEAEMAGTAPEVHDHEPRGALVAGPDGLEDYRRIAATAGQALAPAGLLMLEIGATQAASVTSVLAQSGWTVRAQIADLDQRPRVVIASM